MSTQHITPNINHKPTILNPKGTQEENPIQVLLVDDDTQFLECAKELLEMQANFKVTLACSVDEALKLVTRGCFDVVISDYEMPEKNGLDFLMVLKAQNRLLPFILFTGKDREKIEIKAYNLGVDWFFNKAGDPKTVYNQLAQGILKAVEKQKTKWIPNQNEGQFRLYIEHSPLAVFVLNKKEEMEYVNKAACNLLGYSTKELLDLYPAQLVYTKNPAKCLRGFVELKKSGKIKRELKLKHKNGEPILVNLNSVELPNKKFIVFCENITQHTKPLNPLSLNIKPNIEYSLPTIKREH